MLASAENERYADATVVRVIGNLNIRPIGLGTRSDGAFGLATMDKDALVGLTAPDPLDDDAGWMWWQHFNAEQGIDVGALNITLDVRSKRKLRGDNTGLALLVEMNPGAVGSVEFTFGFRVLLQK